VRFVALFAAALSATGLGGVAAAAEIPGLTVRTSWKKFCFNDQKTGLGKTCDTRAEARNHDDNSLLAAVDIIGPEGEAGKILRVVFPLGVQLKYGTRLIVDGDDPRSSPYVVCTATGCMSDHEATPALLGIMRAAPGLLVQAIDQSGKPLSVTLSLADFGAAYDSPRAEPIVVDEPERLQKPWRDDTLRPDLRPRIR
jgi:invasion protein IalB